MLFLFICLAASLPLPVVYCLLIIKLSTNLSSLCFGLHQCHLLNCSLSSFATYFLGVNIALSPTWMMHWLQVILSDHSVLLRAAVLLLHSFLSGGHFRIVFGARKYIQTCRIYSSKHLWSGSWEMSLFGHSLKEKYPPWLVVMSTITGIQDPDV